MANNQVEGDTLTLLRLLNRRHDDKYRKGLQVKGNNLVLHHFSILIVSCSIIVLVIKHNV